MLLRYKTVYKGHEAEITEKKSRFIAELSYAQNEEEAAAFINLVKKKHNNASHHTFAYRYFDKIIMERQSDDGEPSGTAGLPILSLLRGDDLVNMVVVVTRYFGGTLLGTGGLVRAYSKAAAKAIKESVIIEKILYRNLIIKVDYNMSGKVQHDILTGGEVLENIRYTENVEFVVYIEIGLEEAFIKRIQNLTSARAEIYSGDSVYAALIDGEFVKLETEPT
ncbi:IMPACT family protein [Anaeropeptidivorans aminofermentans]|jgi:uncharacterized YigZ family protein|uniref:IMPACT family protein n=1 Tax=Anaeropeptidivorans aminofermentans TaxID=2934315 RepID=UPI00202452F2|nr:YigZ family protein [Anaeropeptidivorans aminofermentans]MBE6013450.1 DUF1949 domain-containing protein [Lachnospiraceae bacterium]